MLTRRKLSAGLLATICGAQSRDVHFPGSRWEQRDPGDVGANAGKLDQLAAELGGHGCVVKHGYVVKSWGDQSEKRDWLSSVKPLFSTLLFFAIQESKLKSVDVPVAQYGWALKAKDRGITFRHLANMTSGYARPEPPGAAWAYNDFAIQLYQKTLFERVWQEDAAVVAAAPDRLGALQFEDGLSFDSRRRLFASVRDFARVAWFWLHRGRWRDRQVLNGEFFRQYQQPDVPFSLPHTREAGDDDYLGIGTFGGGSDHFTKFGPGVYGFNWWFNRTSRLHADRTTWPDAPADTILSIGAGGNCSVMFPSHGVVLASSRGRWGQLKGGDPESPMNRHLRLLADATGAP